MVYFVHFQFFDYHCSTIKSIILLILKSGESKMSVENILEFMGLLGPKLEVDPDVSASSQSAGSNGAQDDEEEEDDGDMFSG